MPTSNDWGPAHGNGAGDVVTFEAAVRDIADRHDRPVVDLSDAIDSEASFVDAIHLDREGASFATAALAEAMPPTRGCP